MKKLLYFTCEEKMLKRCLILFVAIFVLFLFGCPQPGPQPGGDDDPERPQQYGSIVINIDSISAKTFEPDMDIDSYYISATG